MPVLLRRCLGFYRGTGLLAYWVKMGCAETLSIWAVGVFGLFGVFGYRGLEPD